MPIGVEQAQLFFSPLSSPFVFLPVMPIGVEQVSSSSPIGVSSLCSYL